MHHAKMVCDVAVGLQETLQHEQSQTENATTILEPIYLMENTVQNTQQNLSTQLHHMQAMMQAVQIQYAAAPQHDHQDYG